MDKIKADELLEKYNNGQANASERKLVESWFLNFEGLAVPDTEEVLEDHFILKDALVKHSHAPKRTKLWAVIAAAASIAIVGALGLFFYIPQSKPITEQVFRYANDVSPGTNKAVLTLADGSKISLNDADNGELAKQAGIEVIKTADGQLMYKATGRTDVKRLPAFNTVETPRGGQHQIILPDGSRVWLNAASKLKFPSTFAGASQRKVELIGEAYFEVAKDRKHPFLVKTDKQEVVVLGTHFNINSYPDERESKTTLLEGSVKVYLGNESALLKPGQQAMVGHAIAIQVENVDLQETVAWKNGRTQFSNADIKSIMRMLSRWYDVEIEYKGQVDTRFTGSVSRSKNISEILNFMELIGGVHFKIEGRRVTVMP